MSGATQAFLILFAIFAAFASMVIIFGPAERPTTILYVERDPITGITSFSMKADVPFSTPVMHDLTNPPTTSIDPGHK